LKQAYQPKERRFPRSVRSYNGEDFSGVNIQRRNLKDGCFSVTDGDIAQS
jgi:hypothetical protein